MTKAKDAAARATKTNLSLSILPSLNRSYAAVFSMVKKMLPQAAQGNEITSAGTCGKWLPSDADS
jgi:hypothetical protein